jgi:hypothetical protein
MKQGEVTWNTMDVIRETIALRRARLQLHNVMFTGTCASNFGAKRKKKSSRKNVSISGYFKRVEVLYL